MTDRPPRFTARWVDLRQLPASFEDQWLALGMRALEGNAFLAPWFLVPAAQWLDPGRDLRLLSIDAEGERGSLGLVGLACVVDAAAAGSLPWPHLAAYRPVHAYCSGALLDPRWPADVLRALLAALPGPLAPRAGALRLSNLRCDGPVSAVCRPLLAGAAWRWFPTRVGARATLPVRPSPGGHPAEASRPRPVEATAAMPRQLRRGLKRLSTSLGRVEFRMLRGAAIDDDAIERHLVLEHAGWKGGRGTALLTRPPEAAFFRAVFRSAAARDAAFFGELLAGGRVVASTSNLVAGRQGFAFKLGWDPQLARCSPGLLVDFALAQHAGALLAGVEFVDSCADPGSYLERIWPGRISVADGYLAWGTGERALLAGLAAARHLRDAARLRARDA